MVGVPMTSISFITKLNSGELAIVTLTVGSFRKAFGSLSRPSKA